MSVRTRVSVPIKGNVHAEMVSFSIDGQPAEHMAILFPGWEKQKSVFVRIHSECLTGDVFGSRRCDCGAQLDEAIQRFTGEGGVILYLRQEGRGIGLYNKLDAYSLQIEKGHDTFEANQHLGFPADARDFRIAATMLLDLGIRSVRLLTNNAQKTTEIKSAGILVTEVVPTQLHITDENLFYLETKRKSGHVFSDCLKKSG